jgi:hypothetical protein
MRGPFLLGSRAHGMSLKVSVLGRADRHPSRFHKWWRGQLRRATTLRTARSAGSDAFAAHGASNLHIADLAQDAAVANAELVDDPGRAVLHVEELSAR